MVFSLFVVSNAQEGNPVCPTIEITGPSGVTLAGDTLTFAITLSSTPINIKYIWSVSRGVIEQGQGTQSIIVRTSIADAGQAIVTTVVIEDLPRACDSKFAEKGFIAERPASGDWILNEYDHEKLSKPDQKGHLDNFFHELVIAPADTGMFLLLIAPGENKASIRKRIDFILRHSKFRRFDKNRLVFAIRENNRSGMIPVRILPGGRWPCSDCELIYGRDLK